MFPMFAEMKKVLTVKIHIELIIRDMSSAFFRFMVYNTVKNKKWFKDWLKISLLILSKFKQIN